MTKEELVHITLKQLSESLKISPDNFRLEDITVGPVSGSFNGPTIVWQFKVQLKEGQYIQDPHNANRTIIVTFNNLTKQLSCSIYFREVNTYNNSIMPDSQAVVQCFEYPILNRTYRQFMKIRKQLIEQRHEKEYHDYMRKLNNIFPTTHDEELFK